MLSVFDKTGIVEFARALAGLDLELISTGGTARELAGFLENHDEPRAAATFERGKHEASAVITFLSPGLRFFHHGQFSGRKKRISPHLVRAPLEQADDSLQHFYDRLLKLISHPVVREGQWRLLECDPAWGGNWTSDCFIASFWQGRDGLRWLIAVNYAGNQSQCYVRLPISDFNGPSVRFIDLMGAASYDRDGSDLASHGLYLDMAPWTYHVFALVSPSDAPADYHHAKSNTGSPEA